MTENAENRTFLADRKTHPRFGHGRLGSHAVHTRIRRAGFEPGGESVDCPGVSAGEHFDVTVGQVDRITGEPQGFGRPARTVAKKKRPGPARVR